MAAAVAVGGSSDSKARVSPVGEREGMGEDTEDPLPMKMDGCKTRVRLEDLQVPHLRQSYTWYVSCWKLRVDALVVESISVRVRSTSGLRVSDPDSDVQLRNES